MAMPDDLRLIEAVIACQDVGVIMAALMILRAYQQGRITQEEKEAVLQNLNWKEEE